MTYQEVVNWLFQQVPNYQHQGGVAYKPGLDRITELLQEIGNPHEKIKTIHIAGTNGKGSVSHILSAIFQNHGYKVGLFTSPHITDFRERVKINRSPIEEAFVVNFFETYQRRFSEIQPSFFEITTALAFEAFAKSECDIAIVETGLGGRLDSTNVIVPELSVITNIGIDHTAFLGDTLEEIATEKAGIIKNNVPVVIGDMDPSLNSLFEKKAAEMNSNILFSTESDHGVYLSDLLGGFQQRNIHTAVTAVGLLMHVWNLDMGKVLASLKNVIKSTSFKGRLQEIALQPRIILDAAHNEEGIANLLKEIGEFDYDTLRIIYGASNDKNWQTIVNGLPEEAVYYFAQFDSKRSVTRDEFERIAEKTTLVYSSFGEVSRALSRCKSDAKSNDLILVCGSFYLMEKII